MPKYLDSRQIGDGGFGEVWTCERDTDGARFAKKKLKPGVGDEAVERFQREVRILSKLDHPNVVSVIAQRLKEAPYFYVMPLYKHSLRNELPSLIGDEDRIHQIFTAILNGVEYAHSEGIIHRDLKPENVLMNSDSDIVVTDFGLGRQMHSESTRKTVTGAWLGTPLYMSPEQVRNAKAADHRSDVFSLGRMLYELYTEPLTSAVQNTSRLPPEIAVLVDRCTQDDPADRFQTVAEFKSAWLTAIGVTPGLSTYDEINTLVAAVTATRKPSRDIVRRLLDLLVANQGDDDLIHEATMKIGGPVVGVMCELNCAFARDLMRRFVQHTVSQAWGFSYTDDIGKVCRRVYESVEDFEIRAEMIFCVLKVGVSHNRYFVMDVFEDLIYAPKRPGETAVLAKRLKGASPRLLQWASGRLSMNRLDKDIRQLLESA